MSSKNPASNAMNYVSNSYAMTFELDNFISFDRILETDNIKISFDKHRQWHEKDEPVPFLMKYNPRQKRYVQTSEEMEVAYGEVTYKTLVDILHNDVKQCDIITLCKNHNIGPKSVAGEIRKYYSKKNYTSVSESTIDINKITDLESFVKVNLSNT